MRICETCHAGAHEPAHRARAAQSPARDRAAARSHARVPPRSRRGRRRATRARCATCHTQMSGNPRQACDECHQTMRPADHRITWRELDHGPEAAADRDRCATLPRRRVLHRVPRPAARARTASSGTFDGRARPARADQRPRVPDLPRRVVLRGAATPAPATPPRPCGEARSLLVARCSHRGRPRPIRASIARPASPRRARSGCGRRGRAARAGPARRARRCPRRRRRGRTRARRASRRPPTSRSPRSATSGSRSRSASTSATRSTARDPSGRAVARRRASRSVDAGLRALRVVRLRRGVRQHARRSGSRACRRTSRCGSRPRARLALPSRCAGDRGRRSRRRSRPGSSAAASSRARAGPRCRTSCPGGWGSRGLRVRAGSQYVYGPWVLHLDGADRRVRGRDRQALGLRRRPPLRLHARAIRQAPPPSPARRCASICAACTRPLPIAFAGRVPRARRDLERTEADQPATQSTLLQVDWRPRRTSR